MRLAVPLAGDEIAPRFCTADRALLVDVEDGRERASERVALGDPVFAERLGLLRSLGVTRLLCGGFNRTWLPVAEGIGIAVSWGLWGDAASIVAAFVAAEDAKEHDMPGFDGTGPKSGGRGTGRGLGPCGGGGGPGPQGGGRRRRRRGRGAAMASEPLPPRPSTAREPDTSQEE